MSEQPENKTENGDDRRVYGRRTRRSAPGAGPLAVIRQIVLASFLVVGAIGIYLSTYDLVFALAIVGYALGRIANFAQRYLESGTARVWMGRIAIAVMLISAVLMLYRAAVILGFGYS